jgi:hypothetical protein
MPISKQRPVTLFSPVCHHPDETLGEVLRIDRPLVGDGALRETQRHRRVVGPFARPQTKRPSADHPGDRGIAVPGLELDRCAERVADGEADEGADRTIPSHVNRAEA